MTYPNFKNKHMYEALFHPEDYVKWRQYIKKYLKNQPTKYILVYYDFLLNYFKRKYKPKKVKLYRLITLYIHKDIALVQITGIGSPNAARVLEELIALGGKNFINVGAAGGLTDFGIYLCDKAVRDEGTSYHYFPKEKYSYPNKLLTNRLGKSLNKQGLNFMKGTTWTIDTPYRETLKEIKFYKDQGIKTVEMEASALFAVARYRKVKIASVFVVSDVLSEDKWNPQFGSKHIKQKLKKVLESVIECLKN